MLSQVAATPNELLQYFRRHRISLAIPRGLIGDNIADLQKRLLEATVQRHIFANSSVEVTQVDRVTYELFVGLLVITRSLQQAVKTRICTSHTVCNSEAKRLLKDAALPFPVSPLVFFTYIPP